MKRNILILCLIINTNILSAQSIFRTGQLQLTNGEQLNGYVQIAFSSTNESKIYFKNSLKNKEYKVFTPLEVAQLKIGKSVKYETRSIPLLDRNQLIVPNEQQFTFLKHIAGGVFDIYQLPESSVFFISFAQDSLLALLPSKSSMEAYKVGNSYKLPSGDVINDWEKDGGIFESETGLKYIYDRNELYQLQNRYIPDLKKSLSHAGCTTLSVPSSFQPTINSLVALSKKTHECLDSEAF
ncbi:MAG: hypothetical protein HC892_04035 [Saprospiraceae bacterium]|nr:hypothetical protein [Saprospiraceae bacterium]